jgi:hypothetical protein
MSIIKRFFDLFFRKDKKTEAFRETGIDYPIALYLDGVEIAQLSRGSYDQPFFCCKVSGLDPFIENWMLSVTKYNRYFDEIEDEADAIRDPKLDILQKSVGISYDDVDRFYRLVVKFASGEKLKASPAYFDDGFLDFRPGEMV